MAILWQRYILAEIITAILFLQSPLLALAQNGWYCSATPGSYLQAASPAVCPATAPNSCSGISEPDYCCPSNTYCAYGSGSVVGCCVYGDTCSGPIGGQETTIYVPSTTWIPSTSYVAQSTVYVAPLVSTVYETVGVTTTTPTPVVVYDAQTTTTNQGIYGDYCSTQTEKGPNLPTTGRGQCGTILIVAGAARPTPDVLPWTIPFVFLLVAFAL